MRSQIDRITTGRTREIYSELLEPLADYPAPHEFIDSVYQRYKNTYKDNPSINGRIFEYLVCETLARYGIKPFYYQAKFVNVANCEFDIALYDERKPVVLTTKVSLRERYKQADLEGIALRQVYRQAKQYLITLSHDEVNRVHAKIADGEVAGIDDVMLANRAEYTALLGVLARQSFMEALAVMPISGAIVPK